MQAGAGPWAGLVSGDSSAAGRQQPRARNQRARCLVDPKVRDLAGDPPAMPRSGKLRSKKGRTVDYYRVGVRQPVQAGDPPGGERSRPDQSVSYGSVDHPETFNYPAFTDRGGVALARQVDQRAHEAGLGSFRPHLLPVDQTLHWANLPGGIRRRDGHGTDHHPYRAQRADRHPPARRPQRPAERRLPRGVVPAEGAPHSSRLRQGGLQVPAGSGRSPRPSSVRAWTPGSAVFQYDNDQRATTMWYHDHTLDDTPQRLRGPGRVLPAARRARRRGRRDAARPCAGARRPARAEHFEIPIAIQDRSFTDDGELFYPDNRAYFEGLDPAQLEIPFWATSSAGAFQRRCADLEPGASSATRSWSTGEPGRSSRCSSGATASAS